MEKYLHMAAQYLAAAGISFLNKESDDSHTNLGFNTDSGTLSTHALSNDGDRLSLNYKKFMLDWNSNKGTISFRLDGATHKEILKWVSEVSHAFLNSEYQYKFHYELPYSVTDDYMFKLIDMGEMQNLMHLRILVQFALERIQHDNSFSSPIRVWPHHFDTGIFESLPSSDVQLGMGLAIPDSICNEHYLYISGYRNNKPIETGRFKELNLGDWRNDEFKGAILPAHNLIESEAVQFFQEAINSYTSPIKI